MVPRHLRYRCCWCRSRSIHSKWMTSCDGDAWPCDASSCSGSPQQQGLPPPELLEQPQPMVPPPELAHAPLESPGRPQKALHLGLTGSASYHFFSFSLAAPFRGPRLKLSANAVPRRNSSNPEQLSKLTQLSLTQLV